MSNKIFKYFVVSMLDDISIFEKNNNFSDVLTYMSIYKALREVLAGAYPDDTIHQLAEKTLNVYRYSGECYLMGERVDAVLDILNNGIRKTRTPGLLTMSADLVVEFLLSLDDEVFAALNDELCASNQEFYASEKGDEDIEANMKVVNNAICSFLAPRHSKEELVAVAAGWLLDEIDGELAPHEAVMLAERIWGETSDSQLGSAIERKEIVLDILYCGIDAGRSIPNKIYTAVAHDMLLAASKKMFERLLIVANDPNAILPHSDFLALDQFLQDFHVGMVADRKKSWQSMSTVTAGNLMRALCPRHGITSDEHRDRIGEIIVNASDVGCCLDVIERFDAVYWMLNKGAYDGHVMDQSIPDFLAAEFLCFAEDGVIDTVLDIVASYHACPSTDSYTPTAEYQAKLDEMNAAVETFFQQKHREQ